MSAAAEDQSFQSLQAVSRQILQQLFGYQQFRPGQQEVIDALLAHRDSLVVLPTGGGKSLCYQIPALAMPGYTLVVSPLIALMKDQVDQLRSYGVAAAYLQAGQLIQEQRALWKQLQAAGLKLLYISPERLLADRFFERLPIGLNFVAIDEAHCVSQWGHDFRPEYRAIGQLKQRFLTLPIVALTATADETTRRDIIQQLGLQQPFCYVGSFDRPNIEYAVQEKFKPLEQLWRFIRQQADPSGIIYCRSRAKVETLAARLQQRGIRVAAYHAGLENEQRQQVQEAYQRDELQMVVATIAFGMGINKPNVRFVVHFDVPGTIESYYQETGRAGRDGLPAQVLLLYDAADMVWFRGLLTEKPEAVARVEGHKLTAMSAFAEAQTCRRLVLLNYFGERRHAPCGHCDICRDPPQQYDGLIDAQKALSCIYRIGQRFGISYVVDVLRGGQQSRIRDYGHQQLSVYGIGREQSAAYWISILRQLIHRGIVVQNTAHYSALQLTAAAKPILQGKGPLWLATPRVPPLLVKKGKPSRCLESAEDDLFLQLRQLRKMVAEEETLPPYAIFHDTVLREMATRSPRTEQQLLAINGIGQRKLARFGQRFLQVIERHITGRLSP